MEKDYANHLARLREVWTKEVQSEDYDAHMFQVGQAQANAQLVEDWLRSKPPEPGSRILFAGAGTGQMFDFVSPEILYPYLVTFTDINHDYLKRLESRVKSKTQLHFHIIVDNVEHPQLPSGYALAMAVLVLEHVDWHLAVAALCTLSVDSVFVVIQENPPNSTMAVMENQLLVGTMRIFREVHPMLLNRGALIKEFEHHGFCLIYSSEKQVHYEKRMVGLGFRKDHTMH